jgi:hypothetical protein
MNRVGIYFCVKILLLLLLFEAEAWICRSTICVSQIRRFSSNETSSEKLNDASSIPRRPPMQRPIRRPMTAAAQNRQNQRQDALQRSEIAQNDPSLLSDVHWEDLSIAPASLRAVTELGGWQRLTQIQALTWAPVVNGTSLVARARTGTGKVRSCWLEHYMHCRPRCPHLYLLESLCVVDIGLLAAWHSEIVGNGRQTLSTWSDYWLDRFSADERVGDTNCATGCHFGHLSAFLDGSSLLWRWIHSEGSCCLVSSSTAHHFGSDTGTALRLVTRALSRVWKSTVCECHRGMSNCRPRRSRSIATRVFLGNEQSLVLLATCGETANFALFGNDSGKIEGEPCFWKSE